MQPSGRALRAHRRYYQEDREGRNGGRLFSLARVCRRRHLSHLPFGTRLRRIRRTHAADRRRAPMEAGARAHRGARSVAYGGLSQARRSGRGSLRCLARQGSAVGNHHIAGCANRLRPDRRNSHCLCESRAAEVSTPTRHCARSQVHPQDHHWRAAHWLEREPGRGSDRQGL